MNILFNWIVENYIELIGVISGILGVWLTARQNIWCWPIGLINVALYIYIFYIAKLYADFGINLFYFFVTIYGWYCWLYGGKNHTPEVVCKIKKIHILLHLLIGTVSFIVIGFFLEKYTQDPFPYWDSLLSVWGVLGTYMMAKKQIENWIVWIIVDLNYIFMYFLKELYPTTILYLIFTILAVYGYFEWKKDLRKIEVTV